MGYRKDIQILRGIAVLLVICFHLEIAGFSSGFLGVDVFFVISGYLMAKMYDPSAKMDFLSKRAKRLLPAYFAVVLVTLVVATGMTMPNDYSQVSVQAGFASFLIPNIGLWLENSYFEKAAFLPLLHLWSLGVEIQFYLLVPVLFWVFEKWKPAYAVFLVGSALLCFIIVGISPKTSFFWLPCRLWQFLIGYGIATYASARYTKGTSSLAWVGLAALLALLCIPLMEVDGKARSFMAGHPGAIALLISVATGAVLAFGLPRRIEANPACGLLERLGTYSYSIYLAHFPVIVLFLYRPFSGTVLKSAGAEETVMLSLLIVVASALLFTCIEKPFRHSTLKLRWMFAPALLVFGVGFAGASVQRVVIPERELLIYEAWFDRDEYRCGKIKRILDPWAISCELTTPMESPAHRILLVGNSFADSIKRTFSSVAEAKGATVHFMVDNRPLMKGGVTAEELMQEAGALRVESIVLHYSLLGMESGMLEQMARRAEEGNLRLVLILPPPAWNGHVPEILWKAQQGMAELATMDMDDYREANRRVFEEVRQIGYDGFVVYETAHAFCRPECEMVSADGKPLYFDAGHLTLTGSERLKGVFEQIIDDLPGRAAPRMQARGPT